MHGPTAQPRSRSPPTPTRRRQRLPRWLSSRQPAPSGGALYGESVAAKWGQLLVIDILYAAFAARHFDATLAHLQETFAAGIKQSRL